MTETVHDHLVVGAGPAGLQAAYCLAKAGMEHAVIEAGDGPGSFFRRFPRHRRLISYNKSHTGHDDPELNLRWDWNSLLTDDDFRFTSYSDDLLPHADDLVRYLRDFADRYGIAVQTGARVRRIGRDDHFVVEAEDGRVWRARRLLVATGLSRPHVPPDVPGIELASTYAEMSVDPADYRGQRVVVVGKGNSGFETANNLLGAASAVHMISPHPVRLAWRTHHVSDLRAVYHHALDTYQLKMQNTILDGVLTRIARRADGRLDLEFRYSHAGGQEWALVVDRVLLCTGFRFDPTPFDDDVRPELAHDGRFPALTHEWESVNVPDLYFCGTLMQSRDFKRSFSGFIHGYRYDIRFLVRLLAHRDGGPDLPSHPVDPDEGAMTRAVISRSERSSALFQLPTFMADAFFLDGVAGGGPVEHVPEVPVDVVLASPRFAGRPVILLTLEYGHLEAWEDPFDVTRDPLDGTTSKFIHPVLRLWVGGELVDTYHVPEDLENEWDKPMYVDPCRAALGRMLAAASAPALARP